MKKQSVNKLIIYTDGGSRGNPGPAAVGVVIKSKDGEILNSFGEKIGRTTNNEAEYRAVILALKKIQDILGEEKSPQTQLEVRLDSELVGRQLEGKYRVKDKNLYKLFTEVTNLRIEFAGVSFKNIPRERNKEADKLVNKALDSD